MRKKEEERVRWDAILEQHRMKKEIEREREERGRMPEPVSARPVPKLRSSLGGGGVSRSAGGGGRPRPRTIHVDQDQDLGAAFPPSRGARGSSSNISGESFFMDICERIVWTIWRFVMNYHCLFNLHLLDFCFFLPYLGHPKGLPRSDSRTSINSDASPGVQLRNRGLGISSMGVRSTPRVGPGSRQNSRPTSRRGSTAFLNDDHNGMHALL